MAIKMARNGQKKCQYEDEKERKRLHINDLKMARNSQKNNQKRGRAEQTEPSKARPPFFQTTPTPHTMQQYQDLLRLILEKGSPRQDRTQTGTRAIFGHQMRFDLQEGFPLITTKRLHTPSIVHELLWFIKGDTNAKYLQDHGVRIWNEWADPQGNLGPIYGHQWRKWQDHDGQPIDQLSQVIHDIQHHPTSRRLIVSAWNVADLPEMALPPCHLLFQFFVANGRLSLQLYQRSADAFLGVPFNIASYALLLHLVAQVTHLQVGEFIHTIGDAHLYNDHHEQARLQLTRTPRPLPRLALNPLIHRIDDFTAEDIAFINYHPHPHIAGKVSV